MVGGGCLEDGGEGDLGGGEERSGSGISMGGSSTTVVYEGVWLREEKCVVVGEIGGANFVSEVLPAHRTERIDPGRDYWAEGDGWVDGEKQRW